MVEAEFKKRKKVDSQASYHQEAVHGQVHNNRFNTLMYPTYLKPIKLAIFQASIVKQKFYLLAWPIQKKRKERKRSKIFYSMIYLQDLICAPLCFNYNQNNLITADDKNVLTLF